MLKRRQIGDYWLFSTGGELRDRYMNEIDSRLTTFDNHYGLLRTLVYGSLYHRDDVGVFVQYLDARTRWRGTDARTIDVDRSDLLDLFVDVKLAEW